MKRFYKTVRLAYETKYWIERLIDCRDKQLQQQLSSNMQQHIEEEILNHYPLDGVALTITLNVTIGSIIECAVKEAEKLSPSEWEALEEEVVNAKERIPYTFESSPTPRIYFSFDAYNKLADMECNIKQTKKREPGLPYMIKLVTYNLYKKTIN